jgi:[acyl-carrier-protein] S-malonyltransferase
MTPLRGCCRVLAHNASRRSSAALASASTAPRRPLVLQVQLRHASTGSARPKTAIFFPGALPLLFCVGPVYLPIH